jgi:sporulation protein YlmC with PRC-barrel domain
MIRKLLASCAVLALISSGVLTAAQAEDNPANPAAVQGAEPAATELAESSEVLTPDRPTLVSVFVGSSVYSSEDPDSDNIGEINDLVVNEAGSITHAIVGVGGFLGLGEKDVAVPFDQLKIAEKDGDTRLIYAATREQLEAAPALDRTAYRRLEHPADQEAADNVQPAAEPADQQAATTEPAQPAAETVTTAEQPVIAETEATNTPEVTFLSLDKDQIWATSLIGKAVYTAENESIGEISDLVMQEEGGETRVALIDVGGFLGIGEKTVAIPFDEIKVEEGTESAAEPKLVVAMTKEQLEALPEVKIDTAAVRPATDPNAETKTAENQAEPAAEVAPATTGSVDAEYQPVTQNIPTGQLIGATVYGPDDSTIGEIGEVILDPKGAIKAVEVDVGGFLGIGEKPVAVSFDALRVRKDEDGNLFVRVDATKEQLEQAPTYTVSEAQ